MFGKDNRQELNLFFILTLLLTVYFPLHLAGTGAVLTYFLTIPTMILSVGCWVTFWEAKTDQPTAIGPSMIRGSLLAQIIVLLAAGAIWMIISGISFIRFLTIHIDINLLNIHTSVGRIFLRYGGGLFALLLVVCGVLIAWGVILNLMLRNIRRNIRAEKNALSGRRTVQWEPVRIRRTIVFLAIAAAGCLIRHGISSGLYNLFYFLLYPGRALANGIFSGLLGDNMGQQAGQIINNIIKAYQTWSGQGNSAMDAVKNFFLSTLQTNTIGTVAAILLFCILIIMIVLLIIRRTVDENA
ncbi:MAG: hypothetical protein LIO56_03735 [Lachnospiraceae bacterium]|nr:hypothetical protein [Lachnospiraceae bacterium]